jgi:hypothetical protein
MTFAQASMLALGLLAGAPQAEPPAGSLEDARKNLREIFKEEYASRTSEARSRLAMKLLKFARRGEEGTIVRLAMCMEARDLAAEADDAATALAAVREAQGLFGVQAELKPLEELEKSLRSAKASSLLADAFLELAEEKFETSDYTTAVAAAAGAERTARRARDSSKVEEARTLLTRARLLEREHAKVSEYEKKLSGDPEDPEANLAVGRFLCFFREAWEKGLGMLARGSDAKLKEVAALDLSSSGDAAKRARAGDAWWAWSGRQLGALKEAARARAAVCYEDALGGLKALERIRVEKRLEEYSRSGGRAAGGWPGNTAGLIFVWESGRKRNEVMDPVLRRRRACTGTFRGRAKLGPGGEMMLAGGAFLAGDFDASLLAACRKTNAFYLEAEIRPDKAEQGGPARIISFSSDPHSRNFTLGQSENRLDLRLRAAKTDLNGCNPSHPLCPIAAGRWNHVIVTYRPGQLVCYLAGKPVITKPAELGDFSNWSKHHFLFGDEHSGERDWAGALRGIAIGCRFIDPAEAGRRYALSARRSGSR